MDWGMEDFTCYLMRLRSGITEVMVSVLGDVLI